MVEHGSVEIDWPIFSDNPSLQFSEILGMILAEGMVWVLSTGIPTTSEALEGARAADTPACLPSK